MIKTLVQHGNSAALIIDKPILELLGVTLESPLKITTDGKSLVISRYPVLIIRLDSRRLCSALITSMRKY